MGIRQTNAVPPEPSHSSQFELAYARDKWAYERLFRGPKPRKKLFPYDGRVRTAESIAKEMGITGPCVLMAARRHCVRAYLLQHGGAYVAAVPSTRCASGSHSLASLVNNVNLKRDAGPCTFGKVRFHAAEGTRALYDKYRRGHKKLPLFMGGF